MPSAFPPTGYSKTASPMFSSGRSAGRRTTCGVTMQAKEQKMTIGTVKWFDPRRGFGFITPDDGSKDAFVHISAVQSAGLDTLSESQRIEYELQPGQDGKSSAENLKLVD